jgi:hypothetical protein
MVQNTGCRRVGLLRDVKTEFDKIEQRFRKKLEKHFEHYGIPGTIMSPDHFRSEGHFPSGGPRSRMVHVFTFKAFQQRIYGITLHLDEIETFIGMEIDVKKQNQANQALLRRVAQRSREYDD